MWHLLLVGDLCDSRALLELLSPGRYSLTLAPDMDALPEVLVKSAAPAVILATLNGRMPSALSSTVFRTAPWLAWNRHDDPALGVGAYERGALAVLPGAVSSEGLARALATAVARSDSPAAPSRRRTAHGPKTYRRGAPIYLDVDDALTVEEGLVATNVLHDDGTEVLQAAGIVRMSD